MKVIVLGGPEDGVERDIQDGVTEIFVPKPVTFKSLLSVGLDDVPVRTEKWSVCTISARDGRRRVLASPGMFAWMQKNFPGTPA